MPQFPSAPREFLPFVVHPQIGSVCYIYRSVSAWPDEGTGPGFLGPLCPDAEQLERVGHLSCRQRRGRS